MASLRDIRKRIRSVRSTQKITRAMKLVSAAKLKRAQAAIVAARPYAIGLREVVTRIAAKQLAMRGTEENFLHPLLEQGRLIRRVMVVPMTSDRGMCGAFNSNIIRRAERFIVEQQRQVEQVELGCIGRRGLDYFSQRRIPMRREYSNIFDKLDFLVAKKIAEQIIQEFVEQELDAVFIVHNHFKSAMTQTVEIEQLLPILPLEEAASIDKASDVQDFIYEPETKTLLNTLLPRYLSMQVWRCLLDSVASEHGARMTAMESATKNATEMIDRLTLSYNRARQAGITKELIEIVSGAEAQKG